MLGFLDRRKPRLVVGFFRVVDLEVRPVHLVRDVPGQGVHFTVPVESVFALIGLERGIGLTRDLILDTIVVDMDALKVYCTYRVALAEELDIAEVQLRYIAADEREAQREKAARMNPDPAVREFVPLPPSLMTKPAGQAAHG